MSIKVHHGPPGSYKTSGAVMDDFIPAARAGRPIVTNVRGLSSRQQVIDTLGELPESFELYYVDTTTAQGRDQLAHWFHWVPYGAFLLIDEAQMIWPKAWKDKDLQRLDYPGGVDAASADKRPVNFLVAFEMHRHYNWDLVLTTPNITKIRPDILGCSEGAYKHKNLAVLGIKGRYIEGFHLAEDSGKSASDIISIRHRKITKEVWGLYESTATGAISDTQAGQPIYKNPKVLAIVACMALALGFSLSRPVPAALGGADRVALGGQSGKEPGSSDSLVAVADRGTAGAAVSHSVQPRSSLAKGVYDGLLASAVGHLRLAAVAVSPSGISGYIEHEGAVIRIAALVRDGWGVSYESGALRLKKGSTSFTVF